MRMSEYSLARRHNNSAVGRASDMADSLDQLLGNNRDTTGTGPSSETGSRAASRPVSLGTDMNGPKLELLPENLKRALRDGQICQQRDRCDTDSYNESDGLIDKEAPTLCDVHRTMPPTFTDLIRINVGGTVFVTQRSTLRRIPNTRLANLSESDPNYNSDIGEWFFDRNPSLFNSFLDFYRTGELHFPHMYCGPSIKKELIFWQMDESDISPCCWNKYRLFEQERKIFDHLDRAFESRTLAQYTTEAPDADPPTLTKWERMKKAVYIFMEEPMSSKAAKIWTACFLLFVLISIGILCIETHPKLRVPMDIKRGAAIPGGLASGTSGEFNVLLNTTYDPSAYTLSNQTSVPVGKPEKVITNQKIKTMVTTVPHPALEHIDSFLTSFFTLEFVVRFTVCPNKVRFWKSVMNIIDVLCVLPMWIKYLMQLYEINLDENLLPVFFIIMVLRVLRICRVLRLARHYTGVKILLLALKASLRELFMLLVFVFIVILIFAVVIYYAEFFEPDTFMTIPDGYWWAIITLTTVGYGDMYPKSGMGYVVGALCALTGILATGLPVPIIANNFNLYYSHAALKEAISNRKPGRHRAITPDNTCTGTDKDSVVLKEASV